MEKYRNVFIFDDLDFGYMIKIQYCIQLLDDYLIV